MTQLRDADRVIMLAYSAQLLPQGAEVTKLLKSLHQARGGYRADTMAGGTRGVVCTDGGPTARYDAAKDPAVQAERRLDELIRLVAGASKELSEMHRMWTTTVKGTTSGVGEPGCEVAAAAGSWEPEHRYSDIKGNLPRKYRLGRWAYDFVTGHGRLPTRAETEAHLRGRKVRDLTGGR